MLKGQVKKYCSESDKVDDLLEFDYKQSDEFYDAERKFRWWNGKLYMMFGKYANNYSLQDITKKDRGYLEWILSANFSDDIKSLVEDALNGQFPKYETQSN